MYKFRVIFSIVNCKLTQSMVSTPCCVAPAQNFITHTHDLMESQEQRQQKQNLNLSISELEFSCDNIFMLLSTPIRWENVYFNLKVAILRWIRTCICSEWTSYKRQIHWNLLQQNAVTGWYLWINTVKQFYLPTFFLFSLAWLCVKWDCCLWRNEYIWAEEKKYEWK